MITNSLNIKGRQKGTSPKEQGFPCESINNKNPQRERETSRIIGHDGDVYKYYSL